VDVPHVPPGVLVGAGSFLGALVSVRAYVVRPIKGAVGDFRALLELPELVRDLTSTFTRYMGETERRLDQTDSRLHRLEIVAYYILAKLTGEPVGPPPPFQPWPDPVPPDMGGNP